MAVLQFSPRQACQALKADLVGVIDCVLMSGCVAGSVLFPQSSQRSLKHALHVLLASLLVCTSQHG